MNLFERLITRNEKPKVQVDDEISPALNSADLKDLMDFIEQIKSSSKNRQDLYVLFDRMASDSLVGSAIELICDDATQEDEDRNACVWITEEEGFNDKEMVDTLNDFLRAIDIDQKIWSWCYNVVKDGGMFLKTYYSELSELNDSDVLKNKLGYYYEIVPNYLTVSDLQQYGDTVAYGVRKNMKSEDMILYPTKDYIHFIMDRGHKREEVSIKTEDGKDGDPITEKYKIRYGTSYLENAKEAYLLIDLIENLIMAVRFGRSSLYRLFKIEVGGAGKGETARILNEFKRNLSNQESIDVKNQTFYGNKKPVPYAKNIYIPIRNGKGDVTQELVGGDYEVKDLVDLDYFLNKLFAALRVPKAYLGHEEALPGGLGDNSLTRMDIRYARLVKKYQNILKYGIRSIIDFWCTVNNHEDWIDHYEVNMYKIITANENEKRESLMSTIQLAESIKGLLAESEPDPRKLAEYLIKRVLNMDEMYDVIYEGSPAPKPGKEGGIDKTGKKNRVN